MGNIEIRRQIIIYTRLIVGDVAIYAVSPVNDICVNIFAFDPKINKKIRTFHTLHGSIELFRPGEVMMKIIVVMMMVTLMMTMSMMVMLMGHHAALMMYLPDE